MGIEPRSSLRTDGVLFFVFVFCFPKQGSPGYLGTFSDQADLVLRDQPCLCIRAETKGVCHQCCGFYAPPPGLAARSVIFLASQDLLGQGKGDIVPGGQETL